MLLIFDSFARSDQVMAALGAQPAEDLPSIQLAEDGSTAGHVRDYVYRGEMVATSVILAKELGGVAAWRAKANTLIAAMGEATAVLLFHNLLPTNHREAPVTLINPGVDALLQTLGGGGGGQLNDRERAALGKALQLRKPPPLARSRAGRDAQLRRVFAGGARATTHELPTYARQSLEALMNAHAQGGMIQNPDGEEDIALMHEVPDPNGDPNNDADDDGQLALALSASLAERQPSPPRRAIKRTWQEVMHQDGEAAKPGEAVCIACKENRASICITPCAHQVLCDRCARHWMEIGGKCPVCKGECEDLIRPFVSGAE